MKKQTNQVKQVFLTICTIIFATILMLIPTAIIATLWIAYANDDISLLTANICTVANVTSLVTLFVTFLKGDE